MDTLENDYIIQVQDVSMRFNLAKQKVDNLKEYFVKFLKRELMFDEFYALQKVSFNVKKGESLAIIGENGCGKSTLLKAISGIFSPTMGEIVVRGTIAPLIELGAGFDMDLTARENIYLNGAVLGYDSEFMEQHFKEIMDFSELWDFVDVPVKNFSSGMIARLGFSIATVVVPDILIVDEILSVGDFMFQQKCERKMQEMINQGATLIFVSHNTEQVKNLCNRAVWLKHGILQLQGPASEVCDAYVRDMEMGGNGLVTIENISPNDLEEPDHLELNKRTSDKFNFLNLLRAIAILLIMWDHLGPFRIPDWRIAQIINNTINKPLNIIQYFGAFGVSLFFLISGFLVPLSLQKNTRMNYAKTRFIKIFLPLFIYTGIFYFLHKVPFWLLGGENYWARFSNYEWVTNATLINFLVGQPDVINGVTWYLFPTIVLYLLCIIFIKGLQSHSKLIFILFEFILFTITFLPSLVHIPPTFFNILSSLWYIIFIVIGMTVYYVSNKVISIRFFLLSLLVNYYLAVKCIAMYNPQLYEETPFMVSFVYALALFIITMLLNENIKGHKIIDYLSIRSYSIYLTHMMYGGLIYSFINGLTSNFTIQFSIVFTFCLLIASLHYRFIEYPIVMFSKKRTRGVS